MTMITISNMLEARVAFAITVDGDYVFVPPHLTKDVKVGDSFDAILATNPSPEKRQSTPWIAIKLNETSEDKK